MRSSVKLFIAFLVVATSANASAVWRGFASPVHYACAPSDVVLVRDLDGDGHVDIITSGTQVDEFANLSVLRNRGAGTFGDAISIPASFGEKLEDAGDLNHDGIPDLLVSDYWSSGIAVHFGTGALQFAPRMFFATATHGGPSRFIDYDGDGIADIVSLSFGSGNPVRVHLFRGHLDGTVDAKQTFETGLANGAFLSTRTFNGTVELLVAEHSGNLGLMRLINGGVTTSRLSAGEGFDQSSIFADVDEDGIADVINMNQDDTTALEPIFISLGHADGSFSTPHRIGQPRHLSFPVSMRVGDVDGDGHPDLVASDFRERIVYWYRGDGHGNFNEGVGFDTDGAVNDFVLADVNGDGALDIVTANNDHTVSVLLNRGRGEVSRRRAAGH